jgi:hypothetical protein
MSRKLSAQRLTNGTSNAYGNYTPAKEIILGEEKGPLGTSCHGISWRSRKIANNFT